MQHDFFIDWSPDPRDHASLLQRLASANVARAGPGGYRDIAIILRDPEAGEACTGIWGNILYHWLFIELLYVAEPDRGHGLGSRLLTSLEDAAREQGCVGTWLSAYAFQAPAFFEKNGYEQFGELVSDLVSMGDRLCFYRKALRA